MAKILIVDDDVRLCDLLKDFLQDSLIESDCLHNGEDAQALLLSPESSRYGLVLLDVKLPKSSGLEVLQAIRAGSIDIPVLVWTASRDPKDKANAFKLGADDFIFKPCYPEELLERIKALLS